MHLTNALFYTSVFAGIFIRYRHSDEELMKFDDVISFMQCVTEESYAVVFHLIYCSDCHI